MSSRLKNNFEVRRVSLWPLDTTNGGGSMLRSFQNTNFAYGGAQGSALMFRPSQSHANVDEKRVKLQKEQICRQSFYVEWQDAFSNFHGIMRKSAIILIWYLTVNECVAVSCKNALLKYLPAWQYSSTEIIPFFRRKQHNHNCYRRERKQQQWRGIRLQQLLILFTILRLWEGKRSRRDVVGKWCLSAASCAETQK